MWQEVEGFDMVMSDMGAEQDEVADNPLRSVGIACLLASLWRLLRTVTDANGFQSWQLVVRVFLS